MKVVEAKKPEKEETPIVKQKIQVNEEQIQKLKTSEVVMKARDSLALAAAPTNFYQFERDMKSFKNE